MKIAIVCPASLPATQFGGIVFDANPTDGSLFDASNAWMNFYIDHSADFSAGYVATQSDVNNALDGDLWLSLEASSLQEAIGFTLASGAIFSTWDAVGGMAMDNFDTNGELFNSDLSINASAQLVNGSDTFFVGSADVYGNSIPEPTSIALMGLGLLGLGAARKRKA